MRDLLNDDVVVDAAVLREYNWHNLLKVPLLKIVVQLIQVEFEMMH